VLDRVAAELGVANVNNQATAGDDQVRPRARATDGA